MQLVPKHRSSVPGLPVDADSKPARYLWEAPGGIGGPVQAKCWNFPRYPPTEIIDLWVLPT